MKNNLEKLISAFKYIIKMSSYARTMGLTLTPAPKARGRSRTRQPTPSAAPKRAPRRGIRLSGSLTRTVTRRGRPRKFVPPNVYPGPGGQSRLVHSKSNPDKLSKHIFKQFIGKNTTSDQSASFSQSTIGRQATATVAELFTLQDFQQMKNQVLPVEPSNPENDITINNTSAKSAKFFIRKAYSVLHLKNQSNISQKCVILDILCKRDAPNYSAATNVETPLSAWLQGVYADLNQSGLANQQIVGNWPTMSDEFNRYYKIIKKTKLHMEPGFFHEHRIKYNVNKVFNSSTVDNLTNKNVKGWTLTTMIIHYGTLANDTVTNAVTYAPAKIDFAISKSYVYQYMLNNYNTLKQNTTHITTVPNALEHIGDADKVTQPVNNV